MKSIVPLALVLLVLGCDSTTEPTAPKKPRQVEALTPGTVALDIARVRAAAAVGDEKATGDAVHAFHSDLTRAMRLPDASRPIEKEPARAVVAKVEGVRSVTWLDRENLLVLVGKPDLRTQDTIDAVCVALEPLGDTLAVVVHVQNVAATNGDEAESISRNCQLPKGERALMQRKRQVDAVDPALRAEFKRQQKRKHD